MNQPGMEVPQIPEQIQPQGGLYQSFSGDNFGSLPSSGGLNIPPGTILAERFRIEAMIGRGGCGEVYTALDHVEQKMIALKVVSFDPISGPAAFEEVRRELVLRDKVNDFANVLRTYGFFTVSSFRGQFLLLIAMEHAPLGSMRKWLLENRTDIDFRRTHGVELFIQACMGVKTLHSSGLVHLDLKPENLLLVGDPSSCCVKVSDFELSPNAEQRIMNQAFPLPAGWGTFAYKSPEQFVAARQEEITPASDIYSLGIILFEILDPHGKPPFDGSPQDLRQKHLETPVPKLRGLDDHLDAILKRCLAKKPEDRFNNADNLVKAFQSLYGEVMSRKRTTIQPAVIPQSPVPRPPSASPAVSIVESSPAGSPGSSKVRLEPQVTNSLKMVLQLVQPGEGKVGSIKGGAHEGPVHPVTISNSFYLGIHQVTQAQYEKVMGVNPSYFKWPNRPVENVTWDEAKEFCRRLSEHELKEYRLPTEAEWEFACRSGTGTEYPWGDKIDPAHCWHSSNSGKETHDVGTRVPNPAGLYDMCGNVWEWCEDWYGPYQTDSTRDPKGPASGSSRVLRGGSWSDGAEDCRSATRGRADPGLRMNVFGFRVVLVV